MSETSVILRDAIQRLLEVLPDAVRASDCWRWCWEELSDEAQDEVKEARRYAAAALAQNAKGGERE